MTVFLRSLLVLNRRQTIVSLRTMASSTLAQEAAKRVKIQDPVPSDIDISQSVEPYHISKIAEAWGLKVSPLPERLQS